VSRSGAIPPEGLLQLLGSIVLLSSAWPITKVALAAGATPSWFAVGRAGFSGLAAFAVLTPISLFAVIAVAGAHVSPHGFAILMYSVPAAVLAVALVVGAQLLGRN